MKYLSHFLTAETPVYNDLRENLSIQVASSIAAGDVANSTHLSFNNHVGTHIDMPKHFDDAGRTLNDYPASFWQFDHVQLVDIPCEPGYLITIEDLEPHLLPETDLLLLRTGFEQFRDQKVYWHNNPSINTEVGLWLRKHYPALRVVGFDALSLNCLQKEEVGCNVHREFLSEHFVNEPILVVEDMRLAEIDAPISRVIIAPFLIDKANGTPVTVLAYDE